jgi:small subunit ribosomal protein S17
MVGRVVSVKMAKTAVVLVESKKTHALYRKSYVWSKKYLVDDPMGVALGDIVIFNKVAPISKHKHWQIAKVLGKDIVSLEQAELQEEANEAIAEVLPDQSEKEEQSASQQVSESVDQQSGEPEKKAKKPKAAVKTVAKEAVVAKKVKKETK